jgi:hypothetical protein
MCRLRGGKLFHDLIHGGLRELRRWALLGGVSECVHELRAGPVCGNRRIELMCTLPDGSVRCSDGVDNMHKLRRRDLRGRCRWFCLLDMPRRNLLPSGN